MKKNFWMWAVLGVVIFAAIVYALNRGPDAPGEYDAFAQCLTAAGVKMYGADWCPHCAEQKKLFGNSWKYVDYVECDARGDNADPEACDAAGVEGFPTWIFSDGTKIAGQTSLRQLSVKTNCALEAA